MSAPRKRYDVFVTREFERQGQPETAWTRIGVAFPLKTKDGFSVVFDALPVDGKCVMLLHEEKPEGQDNGY